jgi:hypothetical protein
LEAQRLAVEVALAREASPGTTRRSGPRRDSPATRIRQTCCSSPTKTTLHPAFIPPEVAGSFRRRPVIPASQVAKNPAHGGNPRPLPISPEPPRPACHAGGRGFESRRSRKVPANRHLFLSPLAQTSVGFFSCRAHPAPEIAGQSRLQPPIPARWTTGHIAGRPPALGSKRT